jgi:hypothetical protein
MSTKAAAAAAEFAHEGGGGGGDIEAEFGEIDADGDGVLTKDEVAAYCATHDAARKAMGLKQSGWAEQVDALFGEMDEDGSGSVSLAEFAEWKNAQPNHDKIYRIKTDTTARAGKEFNSGGVGTLARGDCVVVLEEATDAGGARHVRTELGWIADTPDLVEEVQGADPMVVQMDLMDATVEFDLPRKHLVGKTTVDLVGKRQPWVESERNLYTVVKPSSCSGRTCCAFMWPMAFMVVVACVHLSLLYAEREEMRSPTSTDECWRRCVEASTGRSEPDEQCEAGWQVCVFPFEYDGLVYNSCDGWGAAVPAPANPLVEACPDEFEACMADATCVAISSTPSLDATACNANAPCVAVMRCASRNAPDSEPPQDQGPWPTVDIWYEQRDGWAAEHRDGVTCIDLAPEGFCSQTLCDVGTNGIFPHLTEFSPGSGNCWSGEPGLTVAEMCPETCGDNGADVLHGDPPPPTGGLEVEQRVCYPSDSYIYGELIPDGVSMFLSVMSLPLWAVVIFLLSVSMLCEVWTSQERKMLKNIMNDAGASAHVEAVRKAVPSLHWHIECYHEERYEASSNDNDESAGETVRVVTWTAAHSCAYGPDTCCLSFPLDLALVDSLFCFGLQTILITWRIFRVHFQTLATKILRGSPSTKKWFSPIQLQGKITPNAK